MSKPGCCLWNLAVTLTIAAVPGALSNEAAAQSYPSRPITMIVPFPAGGPTDAIGRIVAEAMRTRLGQPVIIENAPGGAGRVAAARAVRAAPDGYTLSLGNTGTHVFNGAIHNLPFDLQRDFAPVAAMTTQPMIIDGRNSLPAKDLRELIAWLKANADKATQATAGPGSGSHVAGVFFQRETGTRYQFVPYTESGMRDLIAGRIDMMIDPAANSVPQVRAGTIKAFAIAAKKRLSAVPEIPTVEEAGLPGFHMAAWHALWVPKGTPQDVVAKLNAAVVDSLADQAVRSRLADLGQDIYPRDEQTPEALGALQEAEIEKWWPIIKAAGIKVE